MVEPVGGMAVQAVTKAVAKGVEDGAKEKDLLLKAAHESGDLAPAARALARRVEIKQQILLKIWQPLGRLVGVSQQYFEEDFADELSRRMSSVPEEHVITPRMSIAGPTIQGISYTVEETELRAMYLNLLATASDERCHNDAHPSFAEVIRQLNVAEAELLPRILRDGQVPIAQLRLNSATADDPAAQGYIEIENNLMGWIDDEGEPTRNADGSMWLENWVRLGLVTISYSHWLNNDAVYSWVESSPAVVEAREQFDTDAFKRIEVQRGLLTVTDFGKKFERVVINRPTTDVEPQTIPDGEGEA